MRLRKSAEERRDEIIAVTLQLASEVGPEGITTEAIAKRVGVTQAAIFRHFPRKHDIWAAVVAWLRERVTVRWAEALRQTDDPAGRLRAVVAAQFLFITTIPALPAVLLSRELHAQAGLRAGLLGVMGEFRKTLAGILREGQGVGMVRADISPEAAANLLIALVQGTALRWSLSDGAFDLVAEGEALLGLALEGLAKGIQSDVTKEASSPPY